MLSPDTHTLKPSKLNFSSEESDTSFRTAGSSPRGKTSDSDDASRKKPSNSSTPMGSKSSKKSDSRAKLQNTNAKKKRESFAVPRSPIALRPRNGSGGVAPRVSRIAGYFEHLSRMSAARKQSESSKNSSIANSSGSNSSSKDLSNYTIASDTIASSCSRRDSVLMSTINESESSSSFTPIEKLPRSRKSRFGLVTTVKPRTSATTLQPREISAGRSPKAVSDIMKRRSVQGQSAVCKKTPARPVRHIRTMFSPARAIRAKGRSGSGSNVTNAARSAQQTKKKLSVGVTKSKTFNAGVEIPSIIVTEE